ncbi:MAG: DUF6737 family protein [Nodosilinea sp.]
MTNPVNPASPWQLKPWWCQPWSIVLTALGLTVASWLILHRWWVTLLVAIPLTVWMGYFLILWPRLIMEMGESADGSLPGKNEVADG